MLPLLGWFGIMVGCLINHGAQILQAPADHSILTLSTPLPPRPPAKPNIKQTIPRAR